MLDEFVEQSLIRVGMATITEAICRMPRAERRRLLKVIAELVGLPVGLGEKERK